MIIIAYIVIFLAAVVLFYSFLNFSSRKKGKKSGSAAKSDTVREIPFKGVLKKVNALLKNRYRSKGMANYLEQLKADLEYAGLSETFTPEEYFSIRVIGCAIAFAVSIMLSLGLMVNYSDSVTGLHLILMVSIMTAAGYFLPVLKLNEMIAKRRKEILRALPFTLDLITVSVEAGLDFAGAVERIVSKSDENPLIYEFRLFLSETRLGKRKVEALQRMSDRIDIPQVGAIISSLMQAEELGMRIGQILKIQSLSLRTKRMQSAEKRAMEAPVKMLIPLAIFIFPAVFIVLLGPMIIQFISK